MRVIKASLPWNVLFASLVTCALPLGAQEPWAAAKSEDGISIFTRTAAGSPLKEFRGVVTVKTTLSALVAVLGDVAAYPTWQFNCVSASVVRVADFHHRTTYIVNSSPWPVSGRDLVIRSVLTQDKKSKTVTIWMEGARDAIPEKPGLVRVASLKGFWQLQPAGSGNVQVTYQMLVDPGGSLPASLVNSSVIVMPFNTLQKFRAKVGEAPYKSTRYPEIQEP